MHPLRPPAGAPANLTGAWAELVASELLLSYGFEVFRNLSPKGEHDLVVMLPDSFLCLPVDVTLGHWTPTATVGYRLDSSARVKLASGKKAVVLVVTDRRELFVAEPDPEKKHYSGKYPYAVKYEPFTQEVFHRRAKNGV